MTEYRLILMPLRTPQGPWRPRRAEVVGDALACGLAERDEHDPKRTWWHALAEIEMRESLWAARQHHDEGEDREIAKEN